MILSVRQREIINAAVGLIGESGIQSLTIKNLSGKLDISEPALYRHFNSKFEILDTLLDYFNDGAVAVLESEQFLNLPPLERIEFFMFSRVAQVESDPPVAKVMFSEEFFQDDERLASKMIKMMHCHKSSLGAAIELGQREGSIRCDIDATTIFRLIFGPLRLVFKQWALSGYNFNLRAEITKLWEAEKKILAGDNVTKSKGSIQTPKTK
jgi:AcrR family transcriptional regulator